MVLRAIISHSVLVVAFVLGLAVVAEAQVHIHATYDSNGNEPDEDPHGTHLQANMERAVRVWERALQDVSPSKTFYVKFLWDKKPDVGGSDELARMSHNIDGSDKIRFFTEFKGREDKGNAIPWFIDTSPWTDTEYEKGFSRELWRYPGTDKPASGVAISGDAGDETLSGALDVGYWASTDDPQRADQFDLLTAAVHELGHVVGLRGKVCLSPGGCTYRVPEELTERFLCGDGSGCTLLIDRAKNGAHLTNSPNSLMASAVHGRRILPSQLDILAVLASRDWSTVRMPRADLLPEAFYDPAGPLVWNDWRNWFGNQVATSHQDVYLRHPMVDLAELGGDAEARSLRIAESVDLEIGSDDLVVENSSTIQSFSVVDVAAGGSLSSGSLSLNGLLAARGNSVDEARIVVSDRATVGSGILELDWALVNVDHLETDPFGIVYGNGHVHSNFITNDGLIYNYGNSTSTLWFGGDPDLDPVFDLDGEGGRGRIRATDGLLAFVSGRIEGAFDGEAAIEDGATLRLTHGDGWQIGPSGSLELSGNDPTLQAVSTTVQGGGLVRSSGSAVIASDAVFERDARVEVDEFSSLALIGDTVYSDGDFGTSGHGSVYQVGDMTVSSGELVILEFELFDWDGGSWFGGSTPTAHVTRVEDAGFLNIRGQISPSPSSDGYQGILEIGKGGNVYVVQDWLLEGALCLNGGSIGGGALTVAPGATIWGAGRIDDVDVVNNGTILCAGSIEMGSVSGPGDVLPDCPATCP